MLIYRLIAKLKSSILRQGIQIFTKDYFTKNNYIISVVDYAIAGSKHFS